MYPNLLCCFAALSSWVRPHSTGAGAQPENPHDNPNRKIPAKNKQISAWLLGLGEVLLEGRCRRQHAVTCVPCCIVCLCVKCVFFLCVALFPGLESATLSAQLQQYKHHARITCIKHVDRAGRGHTEGSFTQHFFFFPRPLLILHLLHVAYEY